MAEFRFPLKSKDPTTERNNRSLMDWLRFNAGGGSEGSSSTTIPTKLNDLQDVNAGDPIDTESLAWDGGSQRWEPFPGIPGPEGQQGDLGPTGPEGPEGPAGADGADGADGVDGSGSRASMLMLGGM